MAMEIDTGDTAYPTVPAQRDSMNGEWQVGNSGMTLLDYFAGQAIAGLLADPNNMSSSAKNAEIAYNQALEMIKVKRSWENL